MRSDKWNSRQPPGSLVVSSHSCTEGKAAPPTHAASRLAHGIAPSRWPVKRWRGDGVDAELRFVHSGTCAQANIKRHIRRHGLMLGRWAGPFGFGRSVLEARGLTPGTCGVLKAQPRHIRISTGHDTSGSQIRGQPAVLADGTAHVCEYAVKLPYGPPYCSGRQTDLRTAPRRGECADRCLGSLQLHLVSIAHQRPLHSSLLRVTAGPFRRAQADMSVCRSCERVPSRLPWIEMQQCGISSAPVLLRTWVVVPRTESSAW